ncbi:MAG: acyl--CoA ligase family protein [Candidatus Latescibacterota bacterium]|nr:acyl--CoA ligase family protein [Candidatus Latescibacterota bacterium]
MHEEKVYRTELSPVAFLRRNAYVHPDKTAVVHGKRRYSYAVFSERVNRLSSALLATGLEKHDRVAFLAPNIPPLLEAHFAVPAARGVLVAINTRLGKAEIDHILQHSGARLLFVDRALYPQIAELDLSALQVIEIHDTGIDDDPYETFIATGSPEPGPDLLVDEEEPISINYTSGTTGRPKGVVYTHRGTYLNALGEALETGLTSDSSFLWTLPMFHCNGWCFTWAVTAVGGTHVCLRTVDPERIWQLFADEDISHYNGAPTVHTMLLNSSSAHKLDQPITATIAGAPPSPTLLGQLRDYNFHPIHLYGLTETYGPIAISPWQSEWEQKPLAEQATLLARQGQSYRTADLMRVVDEKTQDVPQDGETMGEVVMHGNNVMHSYFEQPDATAEAFRDGWFHSGDLAVWHPDGTVELRDRQKDIIISGGENISTIEVEQTIVSHPAVLECAVIAVPHEKWGERPKAFVALKEGATVHEEELVAHCRERLAHFKCPDAIEFGPLPKTSTGKVQKFVLREKEWAGRKMRIN